MGCGILDFQGPRFKRVGSADVGRLRKPGHHAPPRGLLRLPVTFQVMHRPDRVDRYEAAQHLGTTGQRRIAARDNIVDGTEVLPARGRNDAVGGAEMLLRAVLDRTHALDRPLVVYVDVHSHAGIGRRARSSES